MISTVESGVVVAYEEGRLWLRMDPPRISEGCASCGLCRSVSDRKEGLLLVESPSPIAIGKRVQIQIDRPSDTLIASLLFGLPLVALLGTGGIAFSFYPEHTSWIVLAGLCGGALGWGGIALLVRWLPSLRPRITLLGLDVDPPETYLPLQ